MPPVMPGQVIMTQIQGQPVPIQNLMMVSLQQHRSFFLHFIFYFNQNVQCLCPKELCFVCLPVFVIFVFFLIVPHITMLHSCPHLNVVIVLK